MSYIIGITGGSASGKTTFLNQLEKSFSKKEMCILSQDNYYKPRELQKEDAKGVTNFDLPTCISHGKFAQDIVSLKNGKEVKLEEYVFNNPAAKSKMLTFKPAPIIVVEGIFVFHFEDIFNQFDLKVFIDAKEHIKLKRRIIRDNEERGYDLDDVLYRYSEHVAPTYEKYIAPYKYDADIVIPNNSHFEKGLEVLVSFLKTKL